MTGQIFAGFLLIFLLNTSISSDCINQYSEYVKIVNKDTSSNKSQELVYTPFGPTVKSNVHFVGRNQYLNVKDDHIEIINNETGKTRKVYNVLAQTENYFLGNKYVNSKFERQKADLSIMDGWITYAMILINTTKVKPTYFSTNWFVPSPPGKSSNQLLYIFNALSGATITGNGNSIPHIIQPVLQWGVSPAGGGKYWAICNWYVSNFNQVFHDSLIKVDPGTELQGIIKLTSGLNNEFNYKSYFDGYTSGLQINNLPQLDILTEAFETYNVQGCDEYPTDEKIRMYEIQILTDSINFLTTWWAYKNNDSQAECSQYTHIVNESSSNGEVHIHFRKPYSYDNFEQVHIYPNPVESQLHISPEIPLYNCRIGVYDYSGKAIQSFFYKVAENEFNIDMKNLTAGPYIFKLEYFSDDLLYNKRSHSFKIIKK